MSTQKVRIVVKLPRQLAEVREVDGDLETYQEILEGRIDTLAWRAGVLVYTNENAFYDELPFNCGLDGHYVRGPMVIVGHAGKGNERPLSLEEAKEIVQYVRGMPSTPLAYKKHFEHIGGAVRQQIAQTKRQEKHTARRDTAPTA